MEFLSHFFESEEASALPKQIATCCIQINKWLETRQIVASHIVSFNVFITAKANHEYHEKALAIRKALQECFPDEGSFNVLAQSTQAGNKIAIEVHAIPPIKNPKTKLIPKVLDGIHYKIIHGEGDEKILFAPCIHQPFDDEDVISASEKSFQTMEQILRTEGMNFSNIVRQWNYIENITKKKQSTEEKKQHYQIFNDVRAKYYSHDTFKQGYPSATGIGTNAGGIAIGFYAVSGKNIKVVPLENPLQVAAFSYSPKVLIGDSAYNENKKESPKFVRAKYVDTSLGIQLFISGTASIRGEKTIGSTGGEQAKITLENIENLLSQKNLKYSGIANESSAAKIQYLRIYIKNQKYSEEIKKVCLHSLPGVPIMFVYADICRDDLLFEIEGIAGF